MRKVFAALCLLAAVPVFAQWLPSGATSGPIYYDQGNVGVGTTNPTGLLTVRSSTPLATMYLDATNTAGYSVLRINSGGSEVGIGGALAVYGSTFLGLADSSVQAGMTSLYGYNQTGLALSAYHASGGIHFYTGGGLATHERMRIQSTGDVGLGTKNPSARLHAFTNNDLVTGIIADVQTVVESNASQTDTALRASVLQNVHAGVTNSYPVRGIRAQGLLNGAGTLNSTYAILAESGVAPGATGVVENAFGAYISLFKNSGSVTNGYGLFVADIPATNGYALYAAGANDVVYVAGNVGVGTATPAYKLHVIGNAHVQGTLTGTDIEATYQDIAEWVPATSDLDPGTVVVLNPNATNEVTPSSTAYDSTVAGVVSVKPGVSLGVRGANKEQVATTGRVLVRVDARNAPIRVGDLLVTSNVSGTAMRSEPMDINGRKFHQPGTIIGKALQPLDGGVGEILVLLSMQ